MIEMSKGEKAMFPTPFTVVSALGFAMVVTWNGAVGADRSVSPPPAFALALAPGEKSEKPDEDDTNPLSADPFVGEFSNDEMAITIRMSVKGYVGEFLAAGRTYPMKAGVDGPGIAGTFTHGEATYRFSARRDGAVLKLTTGQKVYTLSRKGPSAAPAMPVPTPDPTPDPNKPAPAPAPVNPSSALPGSAPSTPNLFSTRAAALPRDAKAEAGKIWAGFPAGAYVVWDEEATLAGQITTTRRSALVFQGLAQGREMVAPAQFTSAGWEISPGRKWGDDMKTLLDLGYAAAKTGKEALQIEGRAVDCATTDYSLTEGQAGPAHPKRLKVWTVTGLSQPPHVLPPFPLPRGMVVLDGSVVRIATVDDEKSRYRLDYQAVSLAHKVKIGDAEIETALFKGRELVETATGQDETHYERAVSNRVPGGVVRLTIERRSGASTLSKLSITAVETGVSKP